ncbi:MAG: ParB N-terminal domain-containing protein [Lactobacillus crispatus]|nr:ParB N-terminal domain-containing protein [Lactobacillus crispatus]
MALDQIKPYKNNPRDNTKAVSKVVESIKQFGFNQPLVIGNGG